MKYNISAVVYAIVHICCDCAFYISYDLWHVCNLWTVNHNNKQNKRWPRILRHTECMRYQNGIYFDQKHVLNRYWYWFWIRTIQFVCLFVWMKWVFGQYFNRNTFCSKFQWKSVGSFEFSVFSFGFSFGCWFNISKWSFNNPLKPFDPNWPIRTELPVEKFLQLNFCYFSLCLAKCIFERRV